MQTLKILPIKVYGFDCGVLDEILDAVKGEQYRDSEEVLTDNIKKVQSKNTVLHKSHTVLGDYLQQCNDEMWGDVKETEDHESRLVTTQCWLNRSDKGQHHRHHKHCNSVVSGILYLTDCSTPTLFTNPNMYTTGFIQVYPETEQHDTFAMHAVAGRALMFPSILWHLVPPQANEGARITISWNTFLEGSISNPDKLTNFSVKII